MRNIIEGITLVLAMILASIDVNAGEIHANGCELSYINGEYIETCKLYDCQMEPYWVNEQYVEIITCKLIEE